MTELKATTMKSLQQEWTAWELATNAPSRIKKREMYSLAKEARRIAKIQEQLSMEDKEFLRKTNNFLKRVAWEFEIPCHKRPSQSPIIGH